MNRTTLRIVAVLAFAASAACNQPAQKPPAPADAGAPKTTRGGTLPAVTFGDGPVARVNGVEIPRKAFDTYYDRFRISMHKNQILYPIGGAEAVMSRVMKRLITEELIRQEAKKQAITAPPQSVQAGLEDIKDRLKRDAQYAEYHRQLGTTEETWRAETEVDVLREEVLRRALKDAIDIQPAVLEAEYKSRLHEYRHDDEIRLSRIRFDVTADATGDTLKLYRDRAKAAITAIKKGAKFEDVAKQLSMGSSADRGGEIGWQPRLAFSSTIAKELWKLKPGQVSQVLEDDRGIYVYKITDFRKAGTLPLEDVRPQLLAELRLRRQAEVLTKLIMDMKNNAKIEILVPELEAAMTRTSTVMPEIPMPDEPPVLPKSSHMEGQ